MTFTFSLRLGILKSELVCKWLTNRLNPSPFCTASRLAPTGRQVSLCVWNKVRPGYYLVFCLAVQRTMLEPNNDCNTQLRLNWLCTEDSPIQYRIPTDLENRPTLLPGIWNGETSLRVVTQKRSVSKIKYIVSVRHRRHIALRDPRNRVSRQPKIFSPGTEENGLTERVQSLASLNGYCVAFSQS